MNKYLVIIIVFLVFAVLGLSYCAVTKDNNTTFTTITEYDTIIKWDTLLIEKPKFATKTKIDTQYVVIVEKDSIYLQGEQKHYSEPNLYDIWISGYEPNLDSVKIYPKTIKESVKTTETKEKTKVYATLGFMAYSGAFIPEAGISIATKGKWLVGAKISYYNNNLVYGATVGYKIGKKQ